MADRGQCHGDGSVARQSLAARLCSDCDWGPVDRMGDIPKWAVDCVAVSGCRHVGAALACHLSGALAEKPDRAQLDDGKPAGACCDDRRGNGATGTVHLLDEAGQSGVSDDPGQPIWCLSCDCDLCLKQPDRCASAARYVVRHVGVFTRHIGKHGGDAARVADLPAQAGPT